MEIERKNIKYRDGSIFQVGNVIEHNGNFYLVSYQTNPGVYIKYFLVDLSNGWMDGNKMYESLEELAEEFKLYEPRLVKAKLTVDYKLVGDAEDENVE
ncbi:MAG: hypothetical protein K5983_09190 [Lactobacillus sp.]|nr:hypothetical protein [Lactobacillus sp.]